jgi:serine protease Do
MKFRAQLCVFALALPLVIPSRATADQLEVTSTPAGATVEIDGVAVGTTPFEKDLPGGYFRKTRTRFGARLEHPMVIRVSLSGYATKEFQMTNGPMSWVDYHGHHLGEYWLLKTDHLHFDLVPISQTFTGNISARLSPNAAIDFGPGLSLEELVARTKPAVVYLKGLEKAGTGFFVSDTGVIATNAHLARGEESLLTLLSGGQQLEAKVVYVDAELDIALAKVEGTGFPHLTLADASTVKQGESVLAIGNPGDAMLFSVTKGIVSAIGDFPSAGPGTWIQTDTPINPGNSGGPLLNVRGEVIGISTQKLVKKGVNGIGFALSAADLLAVLRRFYPNTSPSVVLASAAISQRENEDVRAPIEAAAPVADGYGTVTIGSSPDGAEIFVDEKFVGNAPAKLRLSATAHTIVLKRKECAEWKREIQVLKGSQVNLKAELQME